MSIPSWGAERSIPCSNLESKATTAVPGCQEQEPVRCGRRGPRAPQTSLLTLLNLESQPRAVSEQSTLLDMKRKPGAEAVTPWARSPPNAIINSPLPSRREALLSTLPRLRRCFQRRAEKTPCVCAWGGGIPRSLTDANVGFGLQQQFDTLGFVVSAAVVKWRVSLLRLLCQAPAAAESG